MKKIINIDGRDYSIQSSAFTQFKYKDFTGRNLMQDVNQLSKLEKNDKNNMIDEIDDFTEILLKITYTLISESDPKQVSSFSEFCSSIDNLYGNDSNWASDVIEVAISPLYGGNKTHPQQS